MALRVDFSDPKIQRIIAMILVPIVGFVAFFQFVTKPRIEELDRVKAEVVEVRNRVQSIRRILGAPDELAAEKAALENKLAELRELLPEEENVAMLLDQFTMVENESKVYLIGFEAIETVDEEGQPYRMNRYRVTVEAGFHQFGRFVSGIMTLPRIMSISDLNISPTNQDEMDKLLEGMEDQPRYMTSEYTLTTYIFTELDAGNGGGS